MEYVLDLLSLENFRGIKGNQDKVDDIDSLQETANVTNHVEKRIYATVKLVDTIIQPKLHLIARTRVDAS